jgi:ribosome maturation factor RimP
VNWTNEELKAGIEHCFEDAEDLFLVDATMTASRKGFQLIVKCDSDSGITLDQLARINRSIHDNLILPGLDIEKVAVEVTSPGVSFPVKMPRHLNRLAGHSMKIEHRLETLQNPLECEIISANIEALTVKVKDEELVLNMVDVIQGKVNLHW